MKYQNQITAEIIADSINPQNVRLTTFVLVFPRIILSEFNTHRMLSKNSASSRAIPFKRMLKKVWNDPFVPIKWMKEHKGMQGTEFFKSKAKTTLLLFIWLSIRNIAICGASLLSALGLSKQICNRLLEPFLYHTVIVTGTEWGNFFALRNDKAAEIHIADLAIKMLDQYNASNPKSLKEGEWHIPFSNDLNVDKVWTSNYSPGSIVDIILSKVKIATARCARISYDTFEGKNDYVADLKLHDRLLLSKHMSPFEHCAQCNNSTKFVGNFKGFTQYRKTVKGENQNDNRIIKKYYNLNNGTHND